MFLSARLANDCIGVRRGLKAAAVDRNTADALEMKRSFSTNSVWVPRHVVRHLLGTHALLAVGSPTSAPATTIPVRIATLALLNSPSRPCFGWRGFSFIFPNSATLTNLA